jgi:DNA-binding NtrC family response regulator
MAKVLIIDDDPAMRVTLTRTLIASGYDVGVASDGVKGLAEYRHAPTDVVLIDLYMPNKEGLETIVELRKEFPQTVIVAMSGHRKMDLMLRAAKGLGAVLSIKKPFEPEVLVALIEQAVKLSFRAGNSGPEVRDK